MSRSELQPIRLNECEVPTFVGFETENVVVETVVAKPELIAKEAELSQRPSWGRS